MDNSVNNEPENNVNNTSFNSEVTENNNTVVQPINEGNSANSTTYSVTYSEESQPEEPKEESVEVNDNVSVESDQTQPVEETAPVISDTVVTSEPIQTAPVEESKPVEPTPEPIKADKKPSHLTQVIITIILGILIVYSCGYIVLFDFIIDKRNIARTNTSADLTAANQFELISIVPVIPDSLEYEGAYSIDLKNIDNIEPQVLLNSAYNTAIKSESNILQSETNDYNNFKSRYCLSATDKCFVIYKGTIMGILKRNYGDRQYKLENFQIGNDSNSLCIAGASEYTCRTASNPTLSTMKKVGDLVLSKSDKDHIYLYEKALFLKDYKVENDGTQFVHSIGTIYKYNKYKDGIVLAENVVLNSSSETIDLELITKYSDQVQIFKHTFGHTADGVFYWISTEPVASTEY